VSAAADHASQHRRLASTPRLVAAGLHALLVVHGGLVVGVDDGVGGHTIGVVGLGPGVDGVDVGHGVCGGGEKGEHLLPRGHERVGGR